MTNVQVYTPGAPPTLDRLVRRVDEISTLPHIALRIMEVANNPNSSASELKRVLENDTALAARVLRCVNSAAFGVRTKITNLQQAIAYLGMKQIRNLALTASVNELFKKDDTLGTYRRSLLWKHLVSVAICARLIAMRRKFSNFEDMFLAGLMHDIGIILEDEHAHSFFASVIQALDPKRSLTEVERGQLGFDHTQLGERIAEAWGFPPPVRAAIRHHHNSEHFRGSEIDTVHCVEVANLICSVKGISSMGMQLIQVPRTALEGLSLTKNDLMVLVEDLDQEFAANASLFHV
jgi:putative nucleotidyltransferase with HDIG domain